MEKQVLRYQLDKRVDEGLIRRAKHPQLPLTIYSYTAECQFRGEWDKYTMMSRGLIVDDDMNIVARPFGKFFNYGEKSCPDLPTDLPYQVFEKIDGSLGIYFNYGGKWHVATRGSFDNQFIDYASKHLSLLEPYPPHYTVCTEICMPRDLDGLERAVPHVPGIYLLGAVDTYSNKDMAFAPLASVWKAFLPTIHTGSVDLLNELAKTKVDTEGWVVRWENGFRIKIKTAWYFRLFRAICRLEDTVRDGLKKQTPTREILRDVPEELRDEAEGMIKQIRHYVLTQEHYLIGEVLANWRDVKKEFALAILNHPDKGYLFSLYDDKDITESLIDEAPVMRVNRAEEMSEDMPKVHS